MLIFVVRMSWVDMHIMSYKLVHLCSITKWNQLSISVWSYRCFHGCTSIKGGVTWYYLFTLYRCCRLSMIFLKIILCAFCLKSDLVSGLFYIRSLCFRWASTCSQFWAGTSLTSRGDKRASEMVDMSDDSSDSCRYGPCFVRWASASVIFTCL